MRRSDGLKFYASKILHLRSINPNDNKKNSNNNKNNNSSNNLNNINTRLLSSPIIIRVPFFLLFGFDKRAQKQKGQKGTTQEPSNYKEDQGTLSLGDSNIP